MDSNIKIALLFRQSCKNHINCEKLSNHKFTFQSHSELELSRTLTYANQSFRNNT